MKMIRILLVMFCSVIIVNNIGYDISFTKPLFVLSVLFQFEVFFHYVISKQASRVPLDRNQASLYFSATRILLNELVLKEKTSLVVKRLIKYPQVRFIMQKANIQPNEIPLAEIPKEDILKEAANLVNGIGGKLITSMDFMAAYIMLLEAQSKLLFRKELKKEEFRQILYWARSIYPYEENIQKTRVHFVGAGIGEVLTTGWSPETKKYTQDFSYKAFQQKPHIRGREKEFQLLIEGLSKLHQNNILLVGDPGSGKENLVAYLVKASYENVIPARLNHIKILELMVGPLIAGAANRAELETRLQAIIEEVLHSGSIIMYIPNFQNIVGSSSYDVDLSGALLSYLQDGKLPVIASISVGDYKTYLEKNPIKEAFTVIKLESPDEDVAVRMLQDKSESLESEYNVTLTYKAVSTAIKYADRYYQDAALPGSAASLLEEVASKVVRAAGRKDHFVLETDVVQVIETKTHMSVSTPTGQEKDLLLHLEDKLHERVISQEEAITVIAEALRRLRSGLTTLKRPISFLFLGPTGVGKTETARALASIYFGGEEKMLRLDMSEYADENGVKRLLGAPPGEGSERGELTDKITDNPFSLVLLDEFEKAYPKILDLFLQVFEDGRLTDNKGKTVSFINSIIIATSNSGAEFIREELQKGSVVDKEFSHKVLDHLQSQHLFRPELLNRFDAVIIFKPLGQEEMLKIAKIMLGDLVKRLQEGDIVCSYDELLLQKVATEGYNRQFGARPLRRYIQDSVEDILARQKLAGEINRGDNIVLTVDDKGEVFVKKS